MVILYITDLHGVRRHWDKVLNSDIDLILCGGDITHFGNYDHANHILEPALKSGLQFFAVPGNCDSLGVLRFLDENHISLHGKGIGFREIGFMGLGGSNPTPADTPFELTEQEIAKHLKKGYQDIEKFKTKILVSHVPPEGTVCDVLFNGKHVGSRAVRDFVLNHDIDLCFSGHIHESVGWGELGKTKCINPGPFRNGNFCKIEIINQEIKIIREK